MQPQPPNPQHPCPVCYEKDARNRYDDFVQIVEEWRRDGMKIPFRDLVHETLEEFHTRVKELGDAHFYGTVVDPEKRCELPKQ